MVGIGTTDVNIVVSALIGRARILPPGFWILRTIKVLNGRRPTRAGAREASPGLATQLALLSRPPS